MRIEWRALAAWVALVGVGIVGSASCARKEGTRAAPPPLSSSAPAAAAEAPGAGAVVIGERKSIHSAILGEERTILVHVPAGAEPGARFPVLYLLDGEARFLHVTGTIDFLILQGKMPPVIVVGLGNVDRTRDFTPNHRDEQPTSGGADRFLGFLARELVPAIEASYPTVRYRILIGHSLAGLFAVHALDRMPDLFDGIVSISPSLAWAGDPIRTATEALLTGRPELDRAFYLAVGAEPDDMVSSNRAFAAMLRQRAPRSFRWQFQEMPAEDHGSIVQPAVQRGLEHIFAGWRPPAGAMTVAQLEAHYQALSARFRMTVVPPESALNQLGYGLLAAGKLDEAIAVLRRNAEAHPRSPNVHDSLGEALQQKGDHAAAVKSYELAVKNAALNADPQLEDYRARLEAARARAPK